MIAEETSAEPRFGSCTMNELRRRIRAELPAEIFEPVASRGWLFLPLNVAVAAIIGAVGRHHLPWYVALGVALALGQLYATLGLLVHDLMHGSIVRSQRVQEAISFFGFYPFLLSPLTWRLWHVQAHHANTNSSRDPDALVTLDQYNDTLLARWLVWFAPSARNKIGCLVFYPFWFTAHGLEILLLGQYHRHWEIENYRFDRPRAIVQTAFVFAFWAAVCAYVGALNSLFVVVLPMMIGNVILLAFISTQHTFLPRSEFTREGHALENTISVRVPWIVDKFNLNFSHHVEHHLFPSMNYCRLPIVRAWLRRHFADEYAEPTLVEALRVFLSTPRVYADRTHLTFTDEPGRVLVDTVPIRGRLIARDL